MYCEQNSRIINFCMINTVLDQTQAIYLIHTI